MTDDEILTVLDHEIRDSVGFSGGELADQRRTALEYYYGEPFGNEVEGRSEYVSRDLADTIEWIMPSLMRIFTGGDTIVRFEPQGPEDQESSDQATDYVNYIFQRQNDGFLTLYTWFKDALLSKNGFCKVYYEEYENNKSSTYDALSDEEMAMLSQDTEITHHTKNDDGTHAITVAKKSKSGKCCVVAVPPEEILVNKGAKAPIGTNRFVAHRRQVTKSELKEMGYDTKDLGVAVESNDNEESSARFAFDQTGEDVSAHDPKIWFTECYTRIDTNGKGVKLRKLSTAGNKLLDNEETDTIPFVSLTPIILPHKLFGMSVADLVMDIQLLKSKVFRQILDNMELANNSRVLALDGMVNIDDLLTSRPGGIVRVKTFNAVQPMQNQMLGAPAFSLLEYIDQIKENRTGVTRSPLNPDAISKTATGASIMMQAAAARIELIARVFAETGVKDLFYSILECVTKHQKKEQLIRLRNKWVPMDPQAWKNKFDLTVSVGLGTGSKDVLLQHMVEVIKLQMTMMEGGGPVQWPNVINAAHEWLKAGNIKGGEMFFPHADQLPPKEEKPDPALLKAQMDNQTKLQMTQLKDQTAKWKHGTNLQSKERLEAMRMRATDGSQEREMAMRMREAQEDAAQKREKLQVDATLKDKEMRIEDFHRARDRQVEARERAADREIDSGADRRSEGGKKGGQSVQLILGDGKAAETMNGVMEQQLAIAGQVGQLAQVVGQLAQSRKAGPMRVERDKSGRVSRLIPE